ncbi:unnamed protein product, partial [Symbiodinium sp. KB8]
VLVLCTAAASSGCGADRRIGVFPFRGPRPAYRRIGVFAFHAPATGVPAYRRKAILTQDLGGFLQSAASIMSIALEVALLSGKTAIVEVGLEEDMKALKCRAEVALGVGRGRLLDASGKVLASCDSIEEAKLQTGDLLTLQVSRVQVSATGGAFAAILGDGSVVTWGDAGCGGDSRAVQDQLKNVQQIQASHRAFAATLVDGLVVTWGDACSGGDSSAVQAQLTNVQQIRASHHAFVAILGDGSVVTWGDADGFADTSAVQDQLKNVQQIEASFSAFAAILGDGSIVTWGNVDFGGDSRAVKDQLQNVQQIHSSFGAFAAIRDDGSVVTWGDVEFGSDSSAVQDQLSNVQQIQASREAFAAIVGDGSVVTWGDAGRGGDSRALQARLQDVQRIQASAEAFAAILADGSVVTWGDAGCGGDSRFVRDQLQNVQQLQSSSGAFAAVLGDGSVVTWGDAGTGGDASTVQDQLKNVQQIQASDKAFAAIRGDGSVVTWGNAYYGGDSAAASDLLLPFVRQSMSGVMQGRCSESFAPRPALGKFGIDQLPSRVAALGPFGAAYFCAVYAIALCFAVPATPLTLTAGYLFGFPAGFLLAITAGGVSGCICFMLSRIMRPSISRLISHNQAYGRINRAVELEGFKIIFLLRLSPVVPFSILSYACGLSQAAGGFLGGSGLGFRV